MRFYNFKINDNKELKLRLNIEQTVLLERELKESPYHILYNAALGNISIEKIIMILKASLQPYHGDEYNNIESVASLFDEYLEYGGDIQSLMMLITNIFKEAGFFEEEVESNNEKEFKKDYSSESQERDKEMNSLFFELLNRCMEIGMSEDEYWNSTYGEIRRYIESYSKKTNNELKEKLSLIHTLGDLIGCSVARLLDSDAKYPSIIELYPDLFKEEAKIKEEKEKQEKLERIKRSMLSYGNAYKNKNKEKGEN